MGGTLELSAEASTIDLEASLDHQELRLELDLTTSAEKHGTRKRILQPCVSNQRQKQRKF